MKSKSKLFISCVISVSFFIAAQAYAETLLDFNESGASGTNWPGWTWYPGEYSTPECGENQCGADDYGTPGWRKNDGLFTSGCCNGWLPRIHVKSDYGNDSLGRIVTDDAPSESSGNALEVYDTAAHGTITTGTVAAGSNVVTVTDPGGYYIGQRIRMPSVTNYAGVFAQISAISGNNITIVNYSGGAALNASNSVTDSPFLPVYQATSWFLYDQNFSTRTITDDTTNRMDFYIKIDGMTPLDSANPYTQSFHLGTYVCWNDGTGGSTANCPREATPSLPQWWSDQVASYGGNTQAGQHYYHYFGFNNGAWIHAVVDEHPQHARQATNAGEPEIDPTHTLFGKHYFANMNSFYAEIRTPQSTPTSYVIDNLKFWNQVQQENDESITSPWVGYWPDTDKWEIGFQDNSFKNVGYNDYSNSVFEVRYSTSTITNGNYNSATIIEPEYYEVGTENIIRRWSSWTRMAWTRFDIPDNIEQDNNKIYFAIKDVSVDGQHVGSWPYQHGDGHDAPNSLIKTIDYSIHSGASDMTAPAMPSGLSVY